MPLQPLKLLNDQAIGENTDGREDGLGFTEYARTLAGAALGTEGPFTIGVFGDWGTGKTSLMRMIQRELANEEEVLTVWFEAWRYGREEHPILPLVATIIKAIKDQTDKDTKPGRFSKVLNALRALVYGVSLKVTVPGIEAEISTKDMIDRDNQLNEKQKETADNLAVDSLYYNAYEALEQLKLEDSQGKIVVFIDDLDRCLPDVAVQLLESIKLVLNQAGFIFVMGMSRSVIHGYLNHRYQIDFGIKDFVGSEYLDKIVQLSFLIPPHRERMNGFAQSVLAVLKSVDQKHLNEILPIIGIACGFNPRVTIRFVNNLLIDKRIQSDISINYFAITRSLQQFWFRFYQALTGHDSIEQCGKVKKWLGTKIPTFVEEASNDAKIASWLLNSPDLSELLKTEQGQAWLTDHEKRQSAIQFAEILGFPIHSFENQAWELLNSYREKYHLTNLEFYKIIDDITSHSGEKWSLARLDEYIQMTLLEQAVRKRK